MVSKRRLKEIFFTLLSLSVFFLFWGLPSSAEARWHDRSDELPGLTTGQFVKIIVLTAAVATTVVLISRASKNKADEGSEEEKESKNDETTFAPAFDFNMVFCLKDAGQEYWNSGLQPKELPYLGLTHLLLFEESIGNFDEINSRIRFQNLKF